MKYQLKNWGILILLALIWGSSFILMKRGMYASNGETVFSSTQVASLRIGIAAIFLLPVALKSFKRIPWKQKLFGILIVGFLGNFLPAFLFTYAETSINSGLAGMLNSLTPIFTAIIASYIFSDKLQWKAIAGIGIGVVGTFFLVFDSLNTMESAYLAIGAVILATLFYAISVSTIRYVLHDIKPYEISSIALLFTLPASLLFFFTSNTIDTITTNRFANTSMLYILVLSIIGTSLSVILFNVLIARTSAVFASSVTYLIPVVAICWSIFDGEKITILQLVSMMLILVGVLFLQRGTQRNTEN